MNQQRDNNLPSAGSDPLVSAEYRASAMERTPAALDAMVLKKARAAAKNSGFGSFTAFWFRPLAFIATLSLSLALVLELTRTPEFHSVIDSDAETEKIEPQQFETVPNNSPVRTERPDADSDSRPGKPPRSDSAEAFNLNDAAGGRTQSQLTPAPANAAKNTQAPVSANSLVGDEPVSAGFADMVETSSKRMKETDSVVENAIQGLHQTRAAERPQVQAATTDRAMGVVSNRAAASCAEEQIADPVKWWQCITDLKAAGRADEANAELNLLNASYPDFEPPNMPQEN